jgi:hypothetical protein
MWCRKIKLESVKNWKLCKRKWLGPISRYLQPPFFSGGTEKNSHKLQPISYYRFEFCISYTWSKIINQFSATFGLLGNEDKVLYILVLDGKVFSLTLQTFCSQFPLDTGLDVPQSRYKDCSDVESFLYLILDLKFCVVLK